MEMVYKNRGLTPPSEALYQFDMSVPSPSARGSVRAQDEATSIKMYPLYQIKAKCGLTISLKVENLNSLWSVIAGGRFKMKLGSMYDLLDTTPPHSANWLFKRMHYPSLFIRCSLCKTTKLKHCHFVPKRYGIKILHAHLQYACNISLPMKALRGVDFTKYAL